jgi:hypothetical protein
VWSSNSAKWKKTREKLRTEKPKSKLTICTNKKGLKSEKINKKYKHVLSTRFSSRVLIILPKHILSVGDDYDYENINYFLTHFVLCNSSLSFPNIIKQRII